MLRLMLALTPTDPPGRHRMMHIYIYTHPHTYIGMYVVAILASSYELFGSVPWGSNLSDPMVIPSGNPSLW